MTKFRALKIAAVVLVFCVANVVGAAGQTLTTLASFDGTDGSSPLGPLVQGFDGNFYGTTAGGGTNSAGTVFTITPSGTVSTVYNFCAEPNCADGSFPEAGLVLGTDGNFYGTTENGGENNKGTSFKVTPGGIVTTLYSFCSRINCSDGSLPGAALLQATDGNFYGTTIQGGISNACTGGCGTVFRISPNGTFSSVHSFCTAGVSCPDGSEPFAALIQGSDGGFYGTTYLGGAVNFGTVFSISRGGSFATLHSFMEPRGDGVNPMAGLVQGMDGRLYGTTSGCDFGLCNGNGTVYEIAKGGQVGGDYFNGGNGAAPFAALVQGPDGDFYGMTTSGGSGSFVDCDLRPGCGTIFRFGPGHLLTTLYNFCMETNCPDGYSPVNALVQGTDGNFYGVTPAGGADSNGTAFVFSVGFAPFVKALPSSGKTSTSVFILGNNLTGTTNVTFNGTPATFTVVSATEITTSVPTGATSGTVQVTTPSGTLNSNVAFRVN